MAAGLFVSTSDGYLSAARSLWSWLKGSPWLLRPIWLFWVVPASLVVWFLGGLIRGGIVFDFIASLVDGLRDRVIGQIQRRAYAMAASRLAYLLAPLWMLVWLPVVLIVGFVPKIGLAEVLIDHHWDDHDGKPDGRFFQRAATAYQGVLSAALRGLTGHGWAFFPVAAVVMVAMVALCAAAIGLCWSLRLLDWVSSITDWLRKAVVRSAAGLGRGAGSGLFGALVCPVLLAGLFPLFLAVLLVPKLSTSGHQA